MDLTDRFLSQVVKNNAGHARWLNSLSYLEYRGARKIARALETEDMDEEVLTHTMEEVRHALYFKRLAMKLGGNTYSRYQPETLLGEAAIKNYFFCLDAAADKAIETSGSKLDVYRMVTWLIEVRAMDLYTRYETHLSNGGFKISLKPILADETRHLEEVKEHLGERLSARGVDVAALVALEQELFQQTLEALSFEIRVPQEALL